MVLGIIGLFVGVGVLPQIVSNLNMIAKAYPGEIIRSIDAPGNQPGGLTWDGQFLWNADLYDGKIYKLDPSDGSVIKSFDSPGNYPRGLAWDGQYLWNADDSNNVIYKIDPSFGEAINAFSSPGNYPRGLAWDGQYLWNAQSFGIYKLDADCGENQPPVADFSWTPENPEPGEWIYFNPSDSYDPEGLITYYGWDFDGDGIFEFVNDILPFPYKWEQPGDYSASFRLKDFFGLEDTKTKIVVVREENPPTVNINSPEEGDFVKGVVPVEGTANDIDDSIIKVEVKIDDGEWESPIGMLSWTHYWHTTLIDDGRHSIYARSYNGVSYSSVDVVNVTVGNSNEAPQKPSKPSGKTFGITGKDYAYTTNTNDSDSDQIWFNWSWGDGNFSKWMGPYSSGEICMVSYNWGEKGIYEIKVKAKDEFDAESKWSDPLSVSMPKNKVININPILLRFMKQHPCLFPLLRQLLGL